MPADAAKVLFLTGKGMILISGKYLRTELFKLWVNLGCVVCRTRTCYTRGADSSDPIGVAGAYCGVRGPTCFCHMETPACSQRTLDTVCLFQHRLELRPELDANADVNNAKRMPTV